MLFFLKPTFLFLEFGFARLKMSSSNFLIEKTKRATVFLYLKPLEDRGISSLTPKFNPVRCQDIVFIGDRSKIYLAELKIVTCFSLAELLFPIGWPILLIKLNNEFTNCLKPICVLQITEESFSAVLIYVLLFVKIY
jgi:hypothetical protein